MLPTRAQLTALRRRDPVLAGAMRGLEPYPGFPGGAGRRGTHWESLARAIVYQQLAGAAAATIHGRVCALTPGTRFPRPEELLALEDDVLRGAGLSRGKLASLRDLAERLGDGRLSLRAIGRLSDEAIVERLVTVRGIGVWSAQMFLMFRLGRLDVMPSGDLGVREGVRLLDGRDDRPTPAETEERGAAWAPLRSVGAWYMWRLVEAHRAAG
jgi:3-methyladenine DNA glycosylase/8-oxoguanine DNA glycosylase